MITTLQQLTTSQQNLTNALAVGGNSNALNNPKISIRIPSYKGKSKENISYAATALEAAALHLNKVVVII